MPLVEDIIEYVERLLAAGVTRRADVIASVRERFESAVSLDELLNSYFDRKVSLAITKVRDENGERLAFPDRNEAGERVLVHVEHGADAVTLRKIGKRMRRTGKAIVAAGDRLIERADQLEIEFTDVARAA